MTKEFIISDLQLDKITTEDINKVEKIFKVQAMLHYVKGVNDKHIHSYEDFIQEIWVHIFSMLVAGVGINNGLFVKMAVSKAVVSLNNC